MPTNGKDMDVRVKGFSIAKYMRGSAAIKGIKALYRHFRSIQSSSRPMKPPNKMHTAKVKGAETPFEACAIPEK
jgi:hypothetical protein